MYSQCVGIESIIIADCCLWLIIMTAWSTRDMAALNEAALRWFVIAPERTINELQYNTVLSILHWCFCRLDILHLRKGQLSEFWKVSIIYLLRMFISIQKGNFFFRCITVYRYTVLEMRNFWWGKLRHQNGYAAVNSVKRLDKFKSIEKWGGRRREVWLHGCMVP